MVNPASEEPVVSDPQGPEVASSYSSGSKRWFGFITTSRFWVILLLGQILSLCIVGTNTFSGLLAQHGTSIPTFQNIFSYVLLNLVFTTYTIYKYGFKGYGRMVVKDAPKYLALSLLDVEGNYFVVLAYRYTTILSAQLINFWAIVVVVIVSFLLLKVRYHWTQVLGILICCGGMGLLLASDNIKNGSPISGGLPVEIKGDLFMFLGATFYGFANVAEEFLVSQRPLYEVIGQIGFWGVIINGIQAGIVDRKRFQTSAWDSKTGGYMTGFTLCLFLFYSLTPIMFRMSSAAFFNISLLTANFWGLLVGTKLFGLKIFYLYFVAFALILVGLLIYYCVQSFLGESKKPWLGEDQEGGIEGVGTAKRELVKQNRGESQPHVDV